MKTLQTDQQLNKLNYQQNLHNRLVISLNRLNETKWITTSILMNYFTVVPCWKLIACIIIEKILFRSPQWVLSRFTHRSATACKVSRNQYRMHRPVGRRPIHFERVIESSPVYSSDKSTKRNFEIVLSEKLTSFATKIYNLFYEKKNKKLFWYKNATKNVFMQKSSMKSSRKILKKSRADGRSSISSSSRRWGWIRSKDPPTGPWSDP